MSQNVSIKSRLSRAYQALVQPHPSLTKIEDARKAELLATISIIVSSLVITGALATARNVGVFAALLSVTISAYAFSRTAYYWVGAYLFAYAFTALGFYTIFNGRASSIDIAIATTVHIGIIFSSVLLTQRGFLILTLLATGAAFASPLYSALPAQSTDNFIRSGGVVLTIGLILYGINNFRAKIEKEQFAKLNATNQKLEELSASQEQRIQERTQELREASEQLQQRANRLQIISEISQEIVASITQKPEEALGRITQIISKKLGYYHVGIFLLDKEGEFAVLRAANSRGGQNMLTKKHQLKVGGTSIVGYVIQMGRPRIASDTSADAVFFNNPNLPETRSEMALPLKYGNAILGALDVQSALPNAFKDEDANTLSALANQIAIVVKNIQITEDLKYATPKRVIKFSQKDIQHGYAFQPDGSIITTNLPPNNPQIEKAIASGETVILNLVSKDSPPAIAIPVKFRDQLIGVIHIESSEKNRNWTEDEVALIQAIADRAALALENARLLEDSQRRAAKEQAIGEISNKINAAADIESILRTAVRELGAQISGTQVTVEIGGGKK